MANYLPLKIIVPSSAIDLSGRAEEFTPPEDILISDKMFLISDFSVLQIRILPRVQTLQ